MSFENLISDLDALQELRKAAVVEQDEPAEGEEEEGAPELVKALRDEDGEPVEYIDGTELVKSLQEDMDKQSADVLRALTATTELLKAQAAEMTALRGEVAKIAGSGRGRRSVVSVDSELTKADPAGVSPDAFMLKALAAQKAGRLTSVDVAIAEGSLSRGIDVPDHIKTIVFGE